MSSIFLAHSSSDKRFVRRLAADLVEHGVRVWFDEAEIRVGDSFVDKIEEGIKEMDYLGVILSPNSVQSEWVRREVQVALSDEIGGKSVKVLPILYRECEIPGFLRTKKWADFSEPKHYGKAFDELLGRLLPSDTESTSIFRSWTPKGVRLGLLCGLVMTKSGMVVLADRFITTLCEIGRSWAQGELELEDQGELVGHAAAKTIADPDGKETLIPLTSEETTYLFNEISRQVLNLVIEIGTKARILSLGERGVALDQHLTNEVIESIGTHAAHDLQHENDLEPFVIRQFVETVRARLLLFDPTEVEHCYHIGMLVFSLFKDTISYEELEEIVRHMF